MRVFAVLPALSMLLVAAPVSAQAPQTQTPAPAQQPAAPAPDAQQAQTAPAQPLRAGVKHAFINLQVVAAQSAEGKNAGQKILALRNQRQKELETKQKELQTLQQKYDAERGLLGDGGAKLQADIERLQRDLQRSAEDADQELERLQAQLQQEFSDKLRPVIDRVAREKGLDIIFNVADLVWAAPDVDVTNDVIKGLDATSASGAAPAAPAAAAPAPAPAPTAKPAAPAGGKPAGGR